MMVGDISNTFITTPCTEQIWSKAGPEFGHKEGAIVTLKKALYGLKWHPDPSMNSSKIV